MGGDRQRSEIKGTLKSPLFVRVEVFFPVLEFVEKGPIQERLESIGFYEE